MSEHKSDLPNFANPPVSEVVLSCQFSQLSALEAVHFGLFWSAIRSEYPIVETHSPIAPIIETFNEKPSVRPEIRLEVAAIPAVPRVWYLSKDKTHLIQLQQDRIICNWRWVKEGDVYPRYELVRERFANAWEKLTAFIKDEGLGDIEPNQCEVSYLNQIRSGRGWANHSEVTNVLVPWAGLSHAEALADLEGVRVAMKFRMKADNTTNTEALGRLHVDFQPAYSAPNGSPVFVLNLTARGAPLGQHLDGTLNFFDLGRKYIVKGFAELTTPTMHNEWGRHGSGS